MLKVFVSAVNKDLNFIFLSKDDNVVNYSQVFLHENEKHSNNFFFELENALTQLGKKINDIREIYFVVSPGSFMSMRLTKTFILSLELAELHIEIFLTSAFLLSYFLYENTFGKKWDQLLIGIQKTRIKYWTLLLNSKDILKNQDTLFPKEMTRNEIELKLDQADKKFVVIDYFLNLGPRLLLSTSEEKGLDFFNFNNKDEDEKILKIIKGEKFSLTSLDDCIKRKAIFVKLKSFKDYPVLENFQGLFD